MSKRCRRACVALALGLTVATNQAALAKPPGPAGEVVLAPLDTITPCVFFAGQFFQQQCPYFQQPTQARPVFGSDDVLANLEKLTKARELYRRAEDYRRQGRRETAARLYEEAHLVCPTCRYGLQAMERLSQFDAERAEAAAEEQETPDAAGFDWGEVIRLFGCCADVSFGGATRFQFQIPLGIVRVRVEYNSNAPVRVP